MPTTLETWLKHWQNDTSIWCATTSILRGKVMVFWMKQPALEEVSVLKVAKSIMFV